MRNKTSFIVTCTRRVQFCTGHRVYNHEGKCAHLHGHNYIALFTAQAPALDAVGRVVDFSVLKDRLGGWIDCWWDHGFVYWCDDPDLSGLYDGPLAGHKHYALPWNPTAENMALHLLKNVAPLALEGTGVSLVKVQLWETENCYAVAEW